MGVGLGARDEGWRMRLLRDNLFKERECRSSGCPDSSRKGTTGGAGDDGRLKGRKNEGVSRMFVMKEGSGEV